MVALGPTGHTLALDRPRERCPAGRSPTTVWTRSMMPGASSVPVVVSVTFIFVLLLSSLFAWSDWVRRWISSVLQGLLAGQCDAGVELPRLDEPHRDRGRL